MKILFVIHDNKKGGAAISFLELISEVRKKHEVFVLTPHKTGFLPDQLEQRGIRHMPAHYYAWLVWEPANKVLKGMLKFAYYMAIKVNVLEAKRIARLLNKEKFDLVHTNSSVVNFGGLLSKEMKIPHIWHIRELPESFNLMPVISEEKMGRFFKEYSDRIVAISKTVGNRMKEWTKSDNIKVIYNGISQEYDIKKEIFPKPGNVIRFLIAGNICKEKGQEDVILAANELCKQGNSDFHVSVAGNGNIEHLKRLTEEMNLQKHVTILGEVKDMKALRNQTDVEIMASKLEPFGRVTIEAMRASNPIIGTATGGTVELVTEGQNGVLYPYGDYVSLSERMKELILNPQLIEQMGKQAYLDVQGRFTPEQNATNILTLYEEVKR